LAQSEIVQSIPDTLLVRTNQLFTDTITDLYGQARDANNRAVAASDKATKAQDRADKASAHEEELETRTEREINARLALEKLTTWEGPRYLPIRLAEGRFTSELRGFAGQHFAISVCTRDMDQTQGDMRETEIGTVWEAMEFVLHQARWELAGGRLEYLRDNCLSSRITVRVAKEAPKRACDAALALQRVINEALSDNVAVVAMVPRTSHSASSHVLKELSRDWM